MKKIATLALLLWSSSLMAQQTVVAESKIDSVHVYLEGALVHRSFTANLLPGENTIKVDGISHSLNTTAIVIGLEGNLTPSTVFTKSHVWDPYGDEPKYTGLMDSLHDLEYSLKYISDDISALEEELAVLKANRRIGGDNTGLSLEDLKAVSTYMRTRSLEVMRLLTENGRKVSDFKQKIETVKQEIARYKAGMPSNQNEISWLLDVSSPQKVTGTLAYFVRQANWQAEYDVKVANLETDLEITYKANIYNGTWENWDNVKVRVSTATPNTDATLPKLQAWVLNSAAKFRGRSGAGFSQQLYMSNALEDDAAPSPAAMTASDLSAGYYNNEAIDAGEFAVEFIMPKAISLRGNHEQRVYSLRNLQAPSSYQHVTIPKLGPQVYLIAQLRDWDRLNLLSGKASIYLNGKFTGQSNINIRNVTDTLEFSLGIDPQVLVTRKEDENFTERNFIGFNVRERKGYSIVVKNSRSSDITVRLLDQIPISTHEDIEVSLLNGGGATLHEEDGELKWQLEVAPGSTSKVSFSFEVKYPKSMDISLRQQREVYRSPRFNY